jgi:hypothetical protein
VEVVAEGVERDVDVKRSPVKEALRERAIRPVEPARLYPGP